MHSITALDDLRRIEAALEDGGTKKTTTEPLPGSRPIYRLITNPKTGDVKRVPIEKAADPLEEIE